MLSPDGFLSTEKRVQLRHYVAPAPKQYELISDNDLMNEAGGTLVVDTESYYNYFLIAFKNIRTNKILTLELPDDFNSRKLAWIMHNYRTVGFNSISYDLLMIWYSYVNQDTALLQQLSNDIIYVNARKKELLERYKFIIYPTNHIDLIEVCPLKGSLKLYTARLHTKRVQDLPFNVDNDLTPEQIPIVKDYCINDLDDTHELFDFLKERIDLRQSMTIEYGEDLRSKSDAQIAEKVISKEIQKLTGKYPKRPIISTGTQYNYIIPDYINYRLPQLQQMLENVRNTKFEIVEPYGVGLPKELSDLSIQINKGIYRMGIGGLHSYEKNVAYKAIDDLSIIDRDVASYYPSIILNQKLYPDHMGISFLEVYKSLVERRLQAKKSGNKTVDKGLKVAINGTFGKLNSMWSALYSPNLFLQVVLTGQLSLLMLIEMLEIGTGIEVISANTDGIVILCPQDRLADYNATVCDWERMTGFITEETQYKSYYARDVNAYFAIKDDGTAKLKGPWAEIGSATGTKLDVNPNALICTDAVVALLSKNIPIEETILNCKDITRFVTVRNVKGGAHKNGYYLGKTIRWYYSTNIVGTINYITNNNKVPDTDNAMPCMELPSELPTDIAYDWYISRTNEILEEIAYYKKEKQISLF